VIAYAMRRLPFVLRSAEAGLLQLSRGVEDAAQSLVRGRARAVARHFAAGFAAPFAGGLFAFALSMLEVSDSLILAQQQQHFPITKAIYELSQLVARGGSWLPRWVWAMLLLATTVWVARRLVGDRGGGFSEV